MAGCLLPVLDMGKSETLQLFIHPFHGSSGHLWHICEGAVLQDERYLMIIVLNHLIIVFYSLNT